MGYIFTILLKEFCIESVEEGKMLLNIAPIQCKINKIIIGRHKKSYFSM